MSEIVILIEDSDGYNTDSYPIHSSGEAKIDRPCYPNTSGKLFWHFSDEAASMTTSSYYLSFSYPEWIIEFEDANDAMLFKLRWL